MTAAIHTVRSESHALRRDAGGGCTTMLRASSRSTARLWRGRAMHVASAEGPVDRDHLVTLAMSAPACAPDPAPEVAASAELSGPREERPAARVREAREQLLGLAAAAPDWQLQCNFVHRRTARSLDVDGRFLREVGDTESLSLAATRRDGVRRVCLFQRHGALPLASIMRRLERELTAVEARPAPGALLVLRDLRQVFRYASSLFRDTAFREWALAEGERFSPMLHIDDAADEDGRVVCAFDDEGVARLSPLALVRGGALAEPMTTRRAGPSTGNGFLGADDRLVCQEKLLRVAPGAAALPELLDPGRDALVLDALGHVTLTSRGRLVIESCSPVLIRRGEVAGYARPLRIEGSVFALLGPCLVGIAARAIEDPQPPLIIDARWEEGRFLVESPRAQIERRGAVAERTI